MRALLILSLFGLLFLTSCGGNKPLVYNLQGDLVGEIRLGEAGSATIIDSYGQAKGKVRGIIIRDENGKNKGRVVDGPRELSILDENGMQTGSLRHETDCYGRDETFLGRVSTKTDTNAAGGACLLLVLSKQPK